VLTGEGRLDAQTLDGKAVSGVAAAAHWLGVPTIAIVGSTGPGAADCTDASRGGFLRSYVSLSERFGAQRALAEPAVLICQMAREVVSAELTRQAETNP
jgi:glycerate kinase